MSNRSVRRPGDRSQDHPSRETVAVGAFRAVLAEPSEQALARMRSQLPASADAGAGAGAGIGAARQARLAARSGAVRSGRRTMTGPRVAVAAGVAASVVAAGIVASGVIPTGDGGSGGRPPAASAQGSAVQTLELAARNVSLAQPLRPGAGQYLYIRIRSRDLNRIEVPGGARWMAERRQEIWLSADGLAPVLIRVTDGLNAQPLTPQDAAKLRASGQVLRPRTYYPLAELRKKLQRYPSVTPPPVGGEPGPANPTPDYLASLPTDPDRLLAVLRAETASSGSKWSADQQTFELVRGLVLQADALLTPQLRAALYRAIGMLAGVEQVPGRSDLAGRNGVAVGQAQGPVRAELILDPRTWRVIGARDVALTGDDVPVGTVLSWSTQDQRIVGRVGVTS